MNETADKSMRMVLTRMNSRDALTIDEAAEYLQCGASREILENLGIQPMKISRFYRIHCKDVVRVIRNKGIEQRTASFPPTCEPLQMTPETPFEQLEDGKDLCFKLTGLLLGVTAKVVQGYVREKFLTQAQVGYVTNRSIKKLLKKNRIYKIGKSRSNGHVAPAAASKPAPPVEETDFQSCHVDGDQPEGYDALSSGCHSCADKFSCLSAAVAKPSVWTDRGASIWEINDDHEVAGFINRRMTNSEIHSRLVRRTAFNEAKRPIPAGLLVLRVNDSREDRTGDEIGNWHVIGPAPSATSDKRWFCQCALCGRISSVFATNLRSGQSFSCARCRSGDPDPQEVIDVGETDIQETQEAEGVDETQASLPGVLRDPLQEPLQRPNTVEEHHTQRSHNRVVNLKDAIASHKRILEETQAMLHLHESMLEELDALGLERE